MKCELHVYLYVDVNKSLIFFLPRESLSNPPSPQTHTDTCVGKYALLREGVCAKPLVCKCLCVEQALLWNKTRCFLVFSAPPWQLCNFFPSYFSGFLQDYFKKTTGLQRCLWVCEKKVILKNECVRGHKKHRGNGGRAFS